MSNVTPGWSLGISTTDSLPKFLVGSKKTCQLLYMPFTNFSTDYSMLTVYFNQKALKKK